MKKYENLNNKRWAEFRKATVKCKCGHSITFSKSKKVVCWWCGEYVYKNEQDEFKDKLTNLIKG